MLWMCCVLWDLCVCFLCQDGVYISVNKRFLEVLVNLCTKCRTKFDLPYVWGKGNLWSTDCWWHCLEFWSEWPTMCWVGNPALWSCLILLGEGCMPPMGWSLWNMPGALGRAGIHPASCDMGCRSLLAESPQLLTGASCHSSRRVGRVSSGGEANRLA